MAHPRFYQLAEQHPAQGTGDIRPFMPTMAMGIPERDITYLMGTLTGEKREPRKGEWYLSGAIPECYHALYDLDGTPYHIVRIVVIQRTVTITDHIVGNDPEHEQ